MHFSHAVLQDDAAAGYMFPGSMRAQLALQLGERKKASDGYGLIPIVNGENLMAIRDASAFCLTILNCYSRELNLESIRQTTTMLPSGVLITGNQVMMGVAACYNQVTGLGRRLGGIGGITSTEIKSGDPEIETEAVVSDSTKGYLRELGKVVAHGNPIRVYGRVEAIFPPNQILKIKTNKGHSMLIYADDVGLGAVQADTRKNVFVECYGEPRFRFGVESKFFDRVHARSLDVLPDISDLEGLIRYAHARELEDLQDEADPFLQ